MTIAFTAKLEEESYNDDEDEEMDEKENRKLHHTDVNKLALGKKKKKLHRKEKNKGCEKF